MGVPVPHVNPKRAAPFASSCTVPGRRAAAEEGTADREKDAESSLGGGKLRRAAGTPKRLRRRTL